jgi:anti-sigma-K factor RskA
MGDFPQLPEGRTFQVWRVSGDEPDSAAVIGQADLDNDGVTLLIDAGDADAVAVTEEPTGGSEQPTTDALVAVDLA